MLTKSDLSQIRKVVREEVEIEAKTTRSEIQYDVRLVRIELSVRIDKIEDKVKDLRISNTNLDQKVTEIQKNILRIKKDISHLLGYSDENNIRLRKRIEKPEEYVGIANQ